VAVDRVVLTAETLLRERALRRDDAPFSFGNVCEALDLPRTRVRRMMLDPTLGLDTAMFRTSLARQCPRRVGYVLPAGGNGHVAIAAE
jgi:hypothetical protein